MWPIILFFVAQWISSYSGANGLFSCDPNPCLNGGSCIAGHKTPIAAGGWKSRFCRCPVNFFGPRCNNFFNMSHSVINESSKFGNVHVRFIGEDPNIAISFHGRLEVKNGNGEWGAICAKNSSPGNQLSIAKVVCKTFGTGVARYYKAPEELALKGKVVLESLTCTGYELDIDECSSIPGNKCAGDRITFACFRRTQLELRPVPSN